MLSCSWKINKYRWKSGDFVACTELLLNKVVCNHSILEETISDGDKLFTGAIGGYCHNIAI